jgi:homoserine kinase
LKRVTVSAPATVANLGSGFDTLGVALELRNYVSLQESDEFIVVEEDERVQGDDLVVSVITDFLKEHGYHKKVKIEKKNMIPMKKGLGSSSAAIVSALGASMIFLDEFDKDTLFEKAVEIEGHPDNVAPAVFGGLRVSAKVSDRNVSLAVNVPFDKIEVFIPPCEISTVEARKILPKTIPFSDAIFNVQRVAMFISASFNGELKKEYFEDKLHQQKRLSLCKEVKGFFEKVNAMVQNPVFVCGSGPTIGVVGESDIVPPSKWKKLSLRVSSQGFRMEEN